MIEQIAKTVMEAEELSKRFMAQGFKVRILWDGEQFTVKGVRHA